MVKELRYNLPGYGFAKCYVMGQALELLDMLESEGLIEKMKNTYQLGTMRYVYPSAHHTRYEYIFAQLLLISNIVSNEDVPIHSNLSRSSNITEYSSFGEVSGGAVMQCLAILSNVGHMYDTFTSSRILLKLLIDSKNSRTDFYRIYRRNLTNAPIDIKNNLTQSWRKVISTNCICSIWCIFLRGCVITKRKKVCANYILL